MTPEELKIRYRLKHDFAYYAPIALKIRTGEGTIAPFVFNRAQHHIHKLAELQKRDTGKVRIIIVKGRQMGSSTYVEGRFFHQVTNNYGMRSFILTHEDKATNNLFDMAKRFYNHCPEIIRPSIEKNNAKGLRFGQLDSDYQLGTAKTREVGRSGTIQLLHGSEVAFWPNAATHATGVMQCVPPNGGEIFLESTAYGEGNYFHTQWQLAIKGESDFIPVFVPFFWDPKYTRRLDEKFKCCTDEEEELKRIYGLSDEVIYWRRYKIMEFSDGGSEGIARFRQEYPCNAVEAFQNSGNNIFISSELAFKARKRVVEGVGPLVYGVDTAFAGDDRTAIIGRQGRKAFDLQVFKKLPPMRVVGVLHELILNKKPHKVYVDSANEGSAIIDRLHDLGHKDIVKGVSFGSTQNVLQPSKYQNKRHEIWGEMKRWLHFEDPQIPDSEELHQDLCCITYGDGNYKYLFELEPKKELKKRGLPSPDCGDALALTFSEPVTTGSDGRIVDRIIRAAKGRTDNVYY